MLRRRHELASTGFDDFLELVGGDSAGTPEGTGIRVPFAPGFRYRALLAVADLVAGDAVIGLQQYAEIWGFQNSAPNDLPPPPLYPFKLQIGGNSAGNGLPTWHFIDGFITWTLTFQSSPPPDKQYDPRESRSFAYLDSNTPAMVFEDVTFPNLPPEPGYLGLNFYVPPGMLGTSELCMREIRYPWQLPARQPMRYIAPGARRVRLYADVLQTDPTTRFRPSVSAAQLPFLCPEDRFTLSGGFEFLTYYGLVAGRIHVQRRGERLAKLERAGEAQTRERRRRKG